MVYNQAKKAKSDDQNLDLFADTGTLRSAESAQSEVSRDVQPAADLPRGTFATRTELEAEGERNLGANQVTTVESGLSFQGSSFSQGKDNRAGFDPASLTIILGKKADLSSFLHESAHFYLKVLGDLAARQDGGNWAGHVHPCVHPQQARSEAIRSTMRDTGATS